jgi:hypothetical protein
MSDMGRYAAIGVFLALAVMSWRDLSQGTNAEKTIKDIPAPKLSKFAGPSITFLFCYS